MTAVIPKISTASIKGVVTSPEFVAVGSAIFIVPIIAPYIQGWLQKIPYLGSHPVSGMIIIGLIILLIASKMKAGIFRAITLGAAASFVLLAVSPWILNIIRR